MNQQMIQHPLQQGPQRSAPDSRRPLAASPRLVMFVAVLVLGVLLTACGTTKVVDTWQSPTASVEEPDKVAVLAAWPEQLQRLVIEKDLVARMRQSGVNAVESSELPGMRGELTRENVEMALRNANADGAVIVFVIGGGQGGSYERADYWVQNVGGGVGGWYAPYFYDVYTVREGPGFAEQTSQLMLETTYVDVRRVERVWSMVTESKDIEFQDLADKLGRRIVSQMKSADQL
jgi:hypothetical protein